MNGTSKIRLFDGSLRLTVWRGDSIRRRPLVFEDPDVGLFGIVRVEMLPVPFLRAADGTLWNRAAVWFEYVEEDGKWIYRPVKHPNGTWWGKIATRVEITRAEGLPTPLLRAPDGTWRRGTVSADDGKDNFVAVSSIERIRILINEAREAVGTIDEWKKRKGSGEPADS